MSNKLISLSQLQEFKTKSDAKYQDKLTAGSNVSIVNDVVSATQTNPTFVTVVDSGSFSASSGTITNCGSVTLSPGVYFVVYTCAFENTVIGGGGAFNIKCGFSTNTTDITGFGRGWGDMRTNHENITTTLITRVSGAIEVTNSSGQTFYMLAYQNSSTRKTCYPRCYYLKLK